MADERLLKKVHGLSDLELAALLCFITREHCLISTEVDALDDLVQELRLISSRTFGLASAVVDCTPQTTLDDFATALLLPQPSANTTAAERNHSASPYLSRNDSYFPPQPPSRRGPSSRSPPAIAGGGGGGGDTGSSQPATLAMANVVLARNLDRAPKAVQIQALELLRTRRIFTRTAVQTAPKQFLFVAVLGAAGREATAASRRDEPRVTPHLNDFLFISHWHDPADGFANLEDQSDGDEDDGAVAEDARVASRHSGREPSRADEDADSASLASTESIVKRSSAARHRRRTSDHRPAAVLAEADIAHLAQLARQVEADVDVLRYEMNIVSFLRMHRAVAGGVTPAATKHMEQLAKCLAPLHGLDYVTPALVGLAARKVYPHRIVITTPERERSMQWGSTLAAIQALLEGVGPGDVIEDVLDMVAVPA